ncbi:hypothetical protein PENSPDRAFT_684663 [Peniophora sp. CONT]|nr:hypothetical protein PENSPDRAFT_684663 [Peniophora sp. CONT]
MSGLRYFRKHWFAVEAIPIYFVVGGACAGAGWYMYRLAMGPSVIWTKSNPQPWQNVKPGETTKMVTIQHDAKSWTRSGL